MKIEKDSVVRFHYSVAEQGQPSLESSQGNDPLAILVGHGNIIPGLERAMEGHEAGEQAGQHDGKEERERGAKWRPYGRAGIMRGSCSPAQVETHRGAVWPLSPGVYKRRPPPVRPAPEAP